MWSHLLFRAITASQQTIGIGLRKGNIRAIRRHLGTGFIRTKRKQDLIVPITTTVLTFVITTHLWEQSSLSSSHVASLEDSKSTANHDTTSAAMTTLLNWSGTHAVHVRSDQFWEPDTVEDVIDIVRACQERGQSIRPLGSALSPNGLGFAPEGMISLANLDRVVEVNTDQATVTVQAGARVSQVIDALRPYGLTLPNLASIAEQQMGGFIQVGAHGTGRCIAPVDHYVTRLKLITPAQGLVELRRDATDETERVLFALAKVGLGCLGIVVEVTMECIPAHKLVEHTFVLTRAEARKQLDTLLKKHKHMRYMWIPYADAVVVVTNDPENVVPEPRITTTNTLSVEERLAPMTDLLIELTKDNPEPYTKESLVGMGFGEIRDGLLGLNPLDIEHVKLCNEAEAQFWRRNEGYQVKPSDQLLQFDCGGQVSCCPCECGGGRKDSSYKLIAKCNTVALNSILTICTNLAMGLGSLLSYWYTR